jgi:hypothetical protein
MNGFGWNFYGFFLVGVVWCILYFIWAQWMTRREREEEDPKPPTPPPTRRH